MSTVSWILSDHAAALLGVAAWLGAAVSAAVRRPRLALGLLAAAGLAVVGRLVTVAGLADRGWWFVEEKVLLGLPMLVLAGVVAAAVAGPELVAARRHAAPALSTASVVVLFTAAYAALAGVLVTLLAGYPVTWSTALLAVAAVGAAAFLTGYVRETPAGGAAATEESNGRPRSSRRGLLKLTGALVVTSAALGGAGLRFRSVGTVSTGGGPGPVADIGSGVSVADLRDTRGPAPGGNRRRHVLTAQQTTLRLGSGSEIDAWTYDGRSPGPAITATEGDLVEVSLRNIDITDGVTLHWHGYDVACGEDGVPGLTQHPVAPGEEFGYRFRADQVGTYWYHTHFASHIGVRKGLYGTLVVHPRDGVPEELDLTLPIHTFDGTVVIADQDGRLERTAAPGTRVRLRLINTDSDPHRLTLAGTAFRVTAVDGRDLHQPGEIHEAALRLPAGGRYDLVFEVPDDTVHLVVDGDAATGLTFSPHGATASDEPDVDDTSAWPELDLLAYGTPATMPFDAGDADRHFTMVLDRGVAMVDGSPAYAHTVDGRGFPSIPDQLVTEGDLVRFTVVNRSLETHPWHLHGHPVVVLSRNETPASGSRLWVDTFDVRPGEVWEVAFTASNPGIWMNHCHNLPHAHQGMMLRLRYDGVRTPYDH